MTSPLLWVLVLPLAGAGATSLLRGRSGITRDVVAVDGRALGHTRLGAHAALLVSLACLKVLLPGEPKVP